MRKLKLAILLPTFQVAIAAILLEWGYRARLPFPPHGDELYVATSRMICLGITAPAWLLGLLLSVLPLPDVNVFLLHTSDFEFLGGVVVVWYLAGRMFDQRALGQRPQVAGMLVGTALWNLSLMIVGAGLSVPALATLRLLRQYNNPSGNIAEGILFTVWSLVLIVFPGHHLLRALRHRQSDPESITR
jgi:hypothetical protein